MNLTQFQDQIFHSTPEKFNQLALELFHYQYNTNKIYHQYVNLICKDITQIQAIEQIPFLPIQFFKTHQITTEPIQENLFFESSGTTGQVTSKHFVHDYSLYKNSFSKGFHHFFGPIEDYCILGLLPSYLERTHSSLVYMVNDLINASQHTLSGFYLKNFETLSKTLQQLEQQKTKALLFGVTFALLDFAELYPISLDSVAIIETGGMKGRREEMNREQVHAILKQTFSTQHIYSEYGMTELFSQAYSTSNGIFTPVPWMKVLVRDINDPLDTVLAGKGAINVIDLANIHSCAFIATEDQGEVFANDDFKIHGRIDHSELRGCSLMAL
jgi:hypothetical protein